MKNAARRMPRTSSIETPTSTPTETTAKTHWRTAKWKGSPMFIRAAAAGLAAKAITTPMAIRMPTTPSIQRSTVHHQTPRAERSDRGKA